MQVAWQRNEEGMMEAVGPGRPFASGRWGGRAGA